MPGSPRVAEERRYGLGVDAGCRGSAVASAGVTAWSRCNSADAREQRGNDDDGEAFPASDRGKGRVSEVRTVEGYTTVPKWR